MKAIHFLMNNWPWVLLGVVLIVGLYGMVKVGKIAGHQQIRGKH